MKKVLVLILLLSSLLTFANGGENENESSSVQSFEVIVIDALTEDPIPAAKIKIGQKEVEAYTDFDGFAELKQLDQGLYDIEISFISYEKQQLSAFQLDKSSSRLLIKLQNAESSGIFWKDIASFNVKLLLICCFSINVMLI
jgi:hypothetical protein